MAKEGWLTIRNVPKHKATDKNGYNVLLKMFFNKYDVCPRCDGYGYWYNTKRQLTQVPETAVKLHDIEALQHIKQVCDEQGDKISEIVRLFLEKTMWKRRTCSLCNGERVVSRKAYAEYEEKKKDQSSHKKACG